MRLGAAIGTAPRRIALVAGVSVLLVAGGVGFAVLPGDSAPPAAQAPRTTTPAPPAPTDSLSASILRLQETLRNDPANYRSWAELGLGYVEQARISADPTYYAKAQGALETSLGLNETENDVALVAQGALANARHEFGDAADWARRAQKINPESAASYGVLVDALTQLGDYDGAQDALQQMLDLRPGVPAFTRASYNLELHGNIDGARAALEQALAASYEASDLAYCRTYLGQLAFTQGDLDGADQQFTAGLAQTPGDPTLLLGTARVAAARGQADAAVAGYQTVVDKRPLPDNFVEFGNYLLSLGRDDEAAEQFALFDTTQAIFKANGVQDSLSLALLAADQGRGKDAVAAAEQEWSQRQNIDAADALGWALHSAGRDAEALPYAQQATELGGRNASFLFHRGMIEKALGLDDEARDSLHTALTVNPYFSPLHAPEATEALAALGGPR